MEQRAPLARLSPEISSKELEGIASWYGPDFHGRRTANGEIYNMYGMTAAHKTLPFDTMLRVTNLENGRSVVVRVNDRGPYAKGRIIDLSKSAAEKIGMIGPGTARVRLEVLYRR
jgi:rare lipoprotein A